MKNVFHSFIFVFYSLTIFSQSDSITKKNPNIGVVSADKLNVVYRGIKNPISISVPNSKSFTASGQGLNKVSEGKYYLSPGQGLFSNIKLEIELNDGTIKTEEHSFRIIGISSPIALINGENCSKCIVEMTKEELLDSEISIKIEDLLIDIKLEVSGFTVKFPNKKWFRLENNKFDQVVINQILKLKKGDIFEIIDINQKLTNTGRGYTLLPRITPIKIKIVDEEINYYKSKEFIKDSLQKLKIERKLLKKESRKN